MKLKEFKQFVSQIDSEYDEFEVVMPFVVPNSMGNYGRLVSDFLPFRNVICLTGDYKNHTFLEDELRKLEM